MCDFRPIFEIAEIRRGASPRPISDPIYFGGDVGWVRIVDVTRSRRFLRETEQYLSPIGEEKSVRVDKGDLIMSICGTIGRPIIVDMAACIHDGFVQFYNLKNTHTIYLYYALQHAEPAFIAMGQPGTQANLNTKLAGKYKIFFPRFAEQERIANIFTLIDESIENTESVIAKYQQIKAGMMHDLFTRGVDANGCLRPPREQATELYKESPVGWIPKEWDCIDIDNLLAEIPAAIRSGPFGSALLKSELVEEGIPFLGIDNVFREEFENHYIRFVSENKFQELIRYAVRPKDVVITIMGTVGRSCVIPEDIGRALTSKHIWCISLNHEKVIPELVCWQLNYASWVLSWFRKNSQGAVMDAIQSSTLRSLKLPTPPMPEQRKILQKYKAIQQRLLNEERLYRKLTDQKSGLTHDLLTGRVRVKVDEPDQGEKAA